MKFSLISRISEIFSGGPETSQSPATTSEKLANKNPEIFQNRPDPSLTRRNPVLATKAYFCDTSRSQNGFQRSLTKDIGGLGMTLIEIMVVLIIIGLTMTIVTTTVFKKLEEARVRTTQTQIKAVGQPLDLYRQDVGYYPSTAQGLEALLEKPTVGRIPDNWDGPYIKGKKVPTDAWEQPFEYTCEDGRNYTLISRGADKVEGGEGADADISSDDL